MTDFEVTWRLVRQRFVDAIKDLNADQLNWRVYPNTLTIGEMAMHVAGVEVSFATQLVGQEVSGELAKLKAAATDGAVNDSPFPYDASEITPESIAKALVIAESLVAPLVSNPDPYRQVQIQSALGPMIDGTGAFARLAYHPGYHQAQVYMIRTAPNFPN